MSIDGRSSTSLAKANKSTFQVVGTRHAVWGVVSACQLPADIFQRATTPRFHRCLMAPGHSALRLRPSPLTAQSPPTNTSCMMSPEMNLFPQIHHFYPRFLDSYWSPAGRHDLYHQIRSSSDPSRADYDRSDKGKNEHCRRCLANTSFKTRLDARPDLRLRSSSSIFATTGLRGAARMRGGMRLAFGWGRVNQWKR